MKQTLLAGALCAAISLSALAGAQKPTKTAPADALTWRNGLSMMDVSLINRIDRNLGEQDKYMVWTAIVRNREASMDMYPGENMPNDKVLANVRVRMSTDESNRWTVAWSHLNNWARMGVIKVLRDDLAKKH